jgi:hypothetical protein
VQNADGVLTTSTYNVANQDLGLVYDANGNAYGALSPPNHVYDEENRLIQENSVSPSAQALYKYYGRYCQMLCMRNARTLPSL